MPRRLPLSRALLATVTVALALLLTGQTLGAAVDVSNADTRAFLKLLADAIPVLGELWSGKLDGDLCTAGLTYVTCDAITLSIDMRGAPSTAATGSLPELPDSINGDNVMVSEILFSFNGSNITGTLPDTWWRLSNLRALEVPRGELTGTLPVSWGKMSGLERLDLHSNQLTGPLPEEWLQMSNLVTLELEVTSLTGTLPAIRSRMSKLERFTIGGSGITGTLPPEWGSGMPNMKDFRASNTQLSGTLPPEWSQMTRMESFTIGYSQLSGSLPPQYGNWTNLQGLSLSGNRLSSVAVMEEWGDMMELRYVYLHSNALTGDLPNLPNLPALKTLVFSSNAMGGTLSASWGGLTNLTDVRLSGNYFCSCVPDSWHGNAALQFALDWMDDNGVALRAADCEAANVCPGRPPGDLTALPARPAVLAILLLVTALAILMA